MNLPRIFISPEGNEYNTIYNYEVSPTNLNCISGELPHTSSLATWEEAVEKALISAQPR